MIKLRYHHMMCLPRFIGKGYSKDFCNNLAEIRERIKTEPYTLVETADDVCAKCPNLIDGMCIDNEKVTRYDRAVKKALQLGEQISPRNICSDCKWFAICSK
ncbi:MAG: DUF1284 domain-containing protein [Ruminococcaceae bacterium]|nr:DUF1284 domain-containing protein [Oscillospiraceae bacterium]